MKNYTIIAIVCCFLFGCNSQEGVQLLENETLRLERVAPNTFIHTSYLKSYNNFPCNGMVVVHDGEAIVYDTPTDDDGAEQLIDWIQKDLKCNVTAVVCTHFHVDCLGGLAAFHKADIPSYASAQTIKLAQADSVDELPQKKFVSGFLTLNLGKQMVISEFIGSGHTADNIITYFPMDEVLFGGCLIKEIGAGKGNLADAHVDRWPETVKKVKEEYKDAKIIIPGHGKHGGQELLDYTIELFSGE